LVSSLRGVFKECWDERKGINDHRAKGPSRSDKNGVERKGSRWSDTVTKVDPKTRLVAVTRSQLPTCESTWETIARLETIDPIC
jgi:hypothetical protein